MNLFARQRLPGRNNWTTDQAKAHPFITGPGAARFVSITERDVRRENKEPAAEVLQPMRVEKGHLARIRVDGVELYCE